MEAAGTHVTQVLRRDAGHVRPLAVHIHRHLSGALHLYRDVVAVPREDGSGIRMNNARRVVRARRAGVARLVGKRSVVVLFQRIEDTHERLVVRDPVRNARLGHLHRDGIVGARVPHRRNRTAVRVRRRRHAVLLSSDEDGVVGAFDEAFVHARRGRVVEVVHPVVGNPERPAEEGVLWRDQPGCQVRDVALEVRAPRTQVGAGICQGKVDDRPVRVGRQRVLLELGVLDVVEHTDAEAADADLPVRAVEGRLPERGQQQQQHEGCRHERWQKKTDRGAGNG